MFNFSTIHSIAPLFLCLFSMISLLFLYYCFTIISVLGSLVSTIMKISDIKLTIDVTSLVHISFISYNRIYIEHFVDAGHAFNSWNMVPIAHLSLGPSYHKSVWSHIFPMDDEIINNIISIIINIIDNNIDNIIINNNSNSQQHQLCSQNINQRLHP